MKKEINLRGIDKTKKLRLDSLVSEEAKQNMILR